MTTKEKASDSWLSGISMSGFAGVTSPVAYGFPASSTSFRSVMQLHKVVFCDNSAVQMQRALSNLVALTGIEPEYFRL